MEEDFDNNIENNNNNNQNEENNENGNKKEDNIENNIQNDNHNENNINNNHNEENNNEQLFPDDDNDENNDNKIQNENNNQNNNNNQINNNNNQNQENNQINNNANGQEVIPPQPIQQQNNNNNNNVVNNNVNANQNQINEENQKTINIIKSKVKDLKEKYIFCIQFFDIIYKILKNLQDLAYEKITNSTNESFDYFTFFKNTSELYARFSEYVKASNNSITFSSKKPKMNDNFLMGVMTKTQNLLCQNLLNISNGLKNNIISKGPLSSLQDKVNKIETLKKNNSHKFKEIEQLKKNLVKIYNKYEKTFESFVHKTNNNQNRANNRIPSLIDTPDFVYVVKHLLSLINKLILDINLYIIDTKDTFYSINQLFVEINNLVRDSVLIYIKESKNVFNIDVTKNFEEIEKYYKKLEDKSSDKMFKISQIFDTQENQQNFHTLLQQYYVLLSNSGRIKNELLTDRNTFSVSKYPNLLLFFEWLISVSPQPTILPVDDLILNKIKIKRDPGIFSSWKDSIMVFTKQHHLLIFDVPDDFENFVKVFELDKSSYRKKVDNKRPFLFEIIANRKGKVMDFKGSFLFDALNNDNINLIPPLVYSAYNN